MIDSKAYTEVYEVINNMPKEMQEKIPNKMKEAIKNQMDKKYDFKYKITNNGELLEDTKKILSVLYTDYLATEDVRKIIYAKERKLQSKK